MPERFTSFIRRHGIHFMILPLLLGLTIQPSPAEDELQLVFGIYTTDKPTVLVEAYRPILSAIENDLAKKLNRPVAIRLQIASSYELGVSALVNGEVDFSLLGPASYIAAYRSNSSLEILALESTDGSLSFRGLISVHEDSVYTKVSELKGTRFAFGNAGSTIGRYLSQAYLLQHGVSAVDLKQYDYLDRHDRVGYAVSQKSFDAGALKEGTFNNLKKKGLPLRALAYFENVNRPWVARSGLDGRLLESLRSVMINLSAPKAFKALGKKQFVLGDDSNFETIRQAIERNADFFTASDKINSAELENR